MEMRQVEYFRTLSEELNFTRAAKRCGVSQPSLTRSIRLLEEEFGGQLFHREGVNTRLSELGQIVKPHLDEVFNQAQSAAVQALNFKANLTIRLKLGVMCTIAPTDLIQLLTGVRVRHPDIQINVADADTEMLYSRLREGELEAALVGRPENEQPKPGFHYLPLYREQFVIVTGPDHRLSALDSVRCADLHDEAYLRRVNCELADLAGRVFRENGISTRTVYRSDRDDWILAMTAAGLGFSFMPSRSVNHSQVIVAPLTEPEFWREVSLVTVRGRPHSPAVGALVHEAMRTTWMDDRALAVRQIATENASIA
jgi:LysR family hydrogen peroxide-inducible transcriptional activator